MHVMVWGFVTGDVDERKRANPGLINRRNGRKQREKMKIQKGDEQWVR